MPKILLKNATLLDVNHKMVPNQAILIEDDKIAAVGGNDALQSTAETIIDVGGKTVMPGLIDAHIHLGFPAMNFADGNKYSLSYKAIYAGKLAELMIQQGFTTVRDACGIDIGFVIAIDEGLTLGPRVFIADKMISKTGGHGDTRPQDEPMDSCPCHAVPGDNQLIADGVSGVRKAAREVLRRGAHQIKIATSGGVITERNSIHSAAFSKEEIQAIVEEAKDAETYVMSHAHGHEGIRRAIECGVRSIEHCSFLTPELAELMHQHGTYMMPTVFIAKEVIDNKGLPKRIQEKAQAATQAMLKSIQLAREYHLKIGFGSDAFGEPTPRHAEEFIIRAEHEDPYDVIISATAINAEMMQQKDKLGVIKPGAYADLIVVDGDPTKDIRLLADVEGKPISMVLKGGKILKQS